ncbi:MAG: PrsW family intramembrane metalloprotease [Chloroflexota bacterium]|nr:PrsW family intramembrane metalloprotease [Chloroflexota bacterium]
MSSVARIVAPVGWSEWLRLLVGGLLVFTAATVIMFLTQNPDLYPTVIVVGSFLVPVTFVAFLYQHQHASSLSHDAIVSALIPGGLLGILGAAVLEPLILPEVTPAGDAPTLGAAMVVGVIEEGSKLLALAIVARGIRRRGALDGLLLGAAVGMGFAAFESTGYAFTWLVARGGGLDASIVETLTRALAAPFGHGIWTAIAGAALFWGYGTRGWLGSVALALGFGTAVVLHGLWDGLPATPVVALPAGINVALSTVAVAVAGVVLLIILFHVAQRQQGGETPSVPAS